MARLVWAQLLTAALVAALAAAGARAHARACDHLREQYAQQPLRAMSVHGREVPLRVAWDGSAPSRAAAALLAAALRHALGYPCVELVRAEPCRLARSEPSPTNVLDQHIQQVVLMPTVAWNPEEVACAARGTRLRVLGAGVAPLRLRLHVLHARAPTQRCRNHTRWLFYINKNDIVSCDLLDAVDSMGTMEFYYPEECTDTALELAKRAEQAGVRLRPAALRGRAALAAAGARPALLLDYDVWAGPRVHRVELPPGPPLRLERETVRAADENLLRTVAPKILRLFNDLTLKQLDLWELLKSDDDIEEAACSWAANSSDFKRSYNFAFIKAQDIYEIVIFLCKDDPDLNEYLQASNEILDITLLHIRLPSELRLVYFLVNCAEEHSLMRMFTTSTQSAYWPRLVGALGAGEGVEAAAGAAGALDTALAVYDSPAAPLPPAARASSARISDLAVALRHFLSIHGWSRLAVLSDDSKIANALTGSLKALKNLNVMVISTKKTDSAMRTLREKEGRIIFVNTNAALATSVLCGANDSGMTADAGYVWILREWHAIDIKCANVSVPGERLAHFTVSFWQRGAVEGEAEAGAVARALARRWAGRAWPMRAAPLADALMLLLYSFHDFLQRCPHRHTDLHGGNATGLLWKNVEELSIDGVVQKLKINKHGLINPVVFVDQWYGSQRKQIAVWQVYNGTVHNKHSNTDGIFRGKPPSDGTITCITKTAVNEFSPVCYDKLVWMALTAVLLAPPALLAARRARRARLERRDQQRAAGLLARGERAAAALAPHLLDRVHLELQHELGAGRFGRVRFAILRKPGRPPIAVAVKALRDDVSPAEEREFLNEACMLASLGHENIVRLVGVCAVGGPPLLLMEHAFFGDLQRYLSERRDLAGEESAGAEARFVTAAALTRLGRDAAAALEFLAEKLVVHRDVRASNCLVDARRKLKLADFGMARRADVGADGEAEYACRRRGLFPVLWMAPESLERGVFTSASDAWALGVLLLELVTLGARPYAAWSPLRVMRYVSAGGCPPLPADASPDTRRVLARCWRRAPGERASAGALRAQLDAQPALLRPALSELAAPLDHGR